MSPATFFSASGVQVHEVEEILLYAILERRKSPNRLVVDEATIRGTIPSLPCTPTPSRDSSSSTVLLKLMDELSFFSSTSDSRWSSTISNLQSVVATLETYYFDTLLLPTAVRLERQGVAGKIMLAVYGEGQW